jgi:fatty acid desaturase
MLQERSLAAQDKSVTGRVERLDTPIPSTLNVALLLTAVVLAGVLLWFASHAESWVSLILAAVAFSFCNNTLFSLMHEATHGTLHPNPRVNNGMGRVAAAFFPTAFTLQRAFHLTHHRNNRTELEQFDYLRRHDHKLLKLAQWYSILTGLYWAFSPLACLLYFCAHWVFALPVLRRRDSTVAHQTSVRAYLQSVDNVSASIVRLEILLTAGIQAAMAWALDLSLAGWFCCYAAFAANWSSLQYADHAWSPLDVLNGAWNLRVNPLVQAIFLNYHHHLAHHQHPSVPWIHLPRFVDNALPRPSFVATYLRMWRGPRPFPDEHEAPATPGGLSQSR